MKLLNDDNIYLVKSWEDISNRKYQKAINNAKRAKESGCRNFLIYYIIGLSYFNLEQYNDSLFWIKEGLKEYPDQTDLLAVLGGCLIRNDKHEDAIIILQKALNLNRNNSLAWSHLSWLFYNRQNHEMSLLTAKKALELQPYDYGARCNLAASLKEMGKVNEALIEYKKIIRECPELKNGWLGYLFTSLFSENFDGAKHLEFARKFASQIKINEYEKYVYENYNGIKICIGVMSEDIRLHACAYFLIPFLANLDKNIVDVKIFCLNRHKDKISYKIKNIVTNFIDLSELSEVEIINKVRSEKLDVLVDLGGHTGNSPLRYMVHRLARLQVSWLGYPATTGLKEIDFKITDKFADRKDNFKNYTEELLFAPEIFCVYSPLVARPLNAYDEKYKVIESPCTRNGYITFGSCNNIAKLTNKTLGLWAEILNSIANSRILIEAANLNNNDVLVHLKSRLISHDINIDQVDFINRDEENQYLTYNNIDIVLDTTPLTGGTTSCDALWMGVPIITLAGENFHERMSCTLLSNVGLKNFIAFTEIEYIEIAKKMSCKFDYISEIRRSLREKFEKSSIMNANNFCNWFVSEIAKRIGKNFNSNENCKDEFFFSGTKFNLPELHNIIKILIKNNKTMEAINLLENMSAKWPRHWIIANALAEIALSQKRFKEALYKFNDAYILADSEILKGYFENKLFELSLIK